MRRVFVLVLASGILGGCYESGAADASVDAAEADAALVDAGGADDASVDAASPDTGPRDGGTNDAGVDASPMDAGVDAGSDAGDPDAAADAGPDSSVDGGTDAGADGGSDASPDAGADAGPDAGPDPDDPDADGVLTVTEEACGTDPNDGDDLPRADSLRGAGTELDPYRICLPEHLVLLASVSDVLSAHARLGDDLDMTGVSLGPAIGSAGAPFVGVFGGDGFRIDGLVVGTEAEPRAGLFGAVGDGGLVEGLVLSGVHSFYGSVLVDRNAGTVRRVSVSGTATADNHVGLVVNRNVATGVVEDCFSEGTVTAIRSHIGGLVGRSDGLVERCSSTATVSGENRTGGLVGSGAGTVRESLASGAVTGGGMWVGGLVGSARDGALIENGFALGNVSAGVGEAGGVLGNIEGSAVLRQVYAQNTVSGSVASGGVLGVDSSSGAATVTSCFFDSELTASDALCTGLSSAAMTMQASYVGFNFVDVWRMDADVRMTPSLYWE